MAATRLKAARAERFWRASRPRRQDPAPGFLPPGQEASHRLPAFPAKELRCRP